MNNNLINKILSDVHKNSNYEFDSAGTTEYRKTLVLMRTDLNLVAQPLTNQAYITLTSFGKTVCDNGGWLKHLDLEKQKAETEKERKEQKDKADKLDLQMKQWQTRTKYFPYIVSLLALGVSIASYFKAEKNDKTYNQCNNRYKNYKSSLNWITMAGALNI